MRALRFGYPDFKVAEKVARKSVRLGPKRSKAVNIATADFINGSYVANDNNANAAALYSYAGGPVVMEKADGTFEVGVVDVLPLSSLGVQVEIAAKRMTPNPTTPFTDWPGRASSPTVSAYAGTFFGIFANACRVASAGSAFAYIYTTAISVPAVGDVHQCTWIYAAGTSGKVRLVVRQGTGGSNETRIDGLVGSNSFALNNTGTGAFTNVKETKLGTIGGVDFYILRATLTYAIGTAAPSICFGPQSSVAGQDAIFVGAWIDNGSQASGLIIGNPTGEFQRTASVLTILNATNTSPVDVCLTFDDGGKQVFSSKVLPYTIDPSAVRRKWIKKIEVRASRMMKQIVGKLLLGTSYDIGYLPGGGGFSQGYMDLVSNQVDYIVAEGRTKSYFVFPTSNMVPDWSSGDKVWNFSKSIGAAMRLHTICWFFSLDQALSGTYWMKAAIQGTPALWKTYLDIMVAEMVNHKEWLDIDVCNEVLSIDGSGGTGTETGWRTDSGWFVAAKATDGDGRAHVYRAFEKARLANPKAILKLCEYNVERYPAKRDAFLTLVADLKTRGLIDGVNIQGHLLSDIVYDWAAVKQMFVDLAALVPRVGISEFDVRNGSAAAVTPAAQKKLLAQEVAYQFFNAAKQGAGSALDYVVFWGIGDDQSWTNQPQYNGVPQYATPFNTAFQPNPMVDGVKAAFFN